MRDVWAGEVLGSDEDRPVTGPQDTEGLNMWQTDLVREIKRAEPDLPDDVVRAAVSWVHGGELNRHYGPAFTIAYSLKHALAAECARVGVLEEALRDIADMRLDDKVADFHFFGDAKAREHAMKVCAADALEAALSASRGGRGE